MFTKLPYKSKIISLYRLIIKTKDVTYKIIMLIFKRARLTFVKSERKLLSSLSFFLSQNNILIVVLLLLGFLM